MTTDTCVLTTRDSQIWRRTLDTLRGKWSEVPAGLDRRHRTGELLKLDDDELLAFWTRARDETIKGSDGFAARGWYHELYTSQLAGRRVLDVGSGLGFDGLTFAQAGAELTFLDIVADNLALLERLCGLLGVKNASFHHMDAIESITSLPKGHDVLWCQGSLINAPWEVVSHERCLLADRLRTGGRWIELAYPKERWIRDGSPEPEDWGPMTDGEGTPWIEWCDLPRLLGAMAPARFDVVMSFNFHDDDFNWFDLIKRS